MFDSLATTPGWKTKNKNFTVTLTRSLTHSLTHSHSLPFCRERIVHPETRLRLFRCRDFDRFVADGNAHSLKALFASAMQEVIFCQILTVQTEKFTMLVCLISFSTSPLVFVASRRCSWRARWLCMVRILGKKNRCYLNSSLSIQTPPISLSFFLKNSSRG